MSEYDSKRFPPFAVTVDVVVFSVAATFSLLLVRRGRDPFKGDYALPGGFVLPDESVDDAARRELAEETGLSFDETSGNYLEQLQTFGAVDRDPRMRVVSVAYLALLSHRPVIEAGTDAVEAMWHNVEDLPKTRLAFDHDDIASIALERVRAKLEYTTLATSLIGDEFSLAELRDVYELVWGCKLDLPNFRRKVLASDGFVVPTGKRRAASRGAPAQLFRAGGGRDLSPPLMRA